MPHQDVFIDGRRVPSVTEICGIVDKSVWLVPWAAKHGTLKAKALVDYVLEPVCEGDYSLIGEIPATWFEEHNLKREDFWKSDKELTKEAQERGIQRHEEIQKALQNSEPFTEPLVEGIVNWTKRVGFKPVVFEFAVRSERHFYQGTFDCAGYIDKSLVLVDWKFTGRIERSYFMQASAYAHAFKEQSHEHVDELKIIRPYLLKKKAKKDEIGESAGGLKHSFKGSDVYVEEKSISGKDISESFDAFLAARKLYQYLKGD